jgi:hypothetical protein
VDSIQFKQKIGKKIIISGKAVTNYFPVPITYYQQFFVTITINNSFLKSSRGPIHIADKNALSRNLFNLHYCFPLYFEADGGGRGGAFFDIDQILKFTSQKQETPKMPFKKLSTNIKTVSKDKL